MESNMFVVIVVPNLKLNKMRNDFTFASIYGSFTGTEVLMLEFMLKVWVIHLPRKRKKKTQKELRLRISKLKQN